MESEIAQIHKTCSIMEKAVLEAFIEKDVLEEQQIKAAATRLTPSEKVVEGFNVIGALFGPSRSKVQMLCIAGLVGTTCGVVATAYEVVMDRLIDGVWKELGPSVMGPIAQGAGTEWLWIPIVCT